jgi:hypothetical protein
MTPRESARVILRLRARGLLPKAPTCCTVTRPTPIRIGYPTFPDAECRRLFDGRPHHGSNANARRCLRGHLPAIGWTSSVSPNLAKWCRRSRCWQYSSSANRMARLRILAGKMRDALGSDVAVWTVYVAARLLGAPSSAAASPAEMTRDRWTFRKRALIPTHSN